MKLKKEMIEKLEHDKLNCNVFSVYDYNGHSIQELLSHFFTKINECIKVSNDTFKLADWLINEGMEQECAKLLETWLEDGTLEGVINDSLLKEINKNIAFLIEEVKGFVGYDEVIGSINNSTEQIKISSDKYSLNGANNSKIFIADTEILFTGDTKTRMIVGQVPHEHFEGEKVSGIEFESDCYTDTKNKVFLGHIQGDSTGSINDSDLFMIRHNNIDGGNHGYSSTGNGKVKIEAPENTLSLNGKKVEVNGVSQGVHILGDVHGNNNNLGVPNSKFSEVNVKKVEVENELNVNTNINISNKLANNPYIDAKVEHPSLTLGSVIISAPNPRDIQIFNEEGQKASFYCNAIRCESIGLKKIGQSGTPITFEGGADGNGCNLGWSGSKFGQVSAMNGWFNNINDKASLSSFRSYRLGGTKIEDFEVSQEPSLMTRDSEQINCDKLCINVANVINNSDADLFIDMVDEEVYINLSSLVGLLVEEVKTLKNEIIEIKATM